MAIGVPHAVLLCGQVRTYVAPLTCATTDSIQRTAMKTATSSLVKPATYSQGKYNVKVQQASRRHNSV